MLTDTHKMPFGKFKGTPMQDVPVHYLHWLWHNSSHSTAYGDGKEVLDYIKENIEALKMENRDLIWSK